MASGELVTCEARSGSITGHRSKVGCAVSPASLDSMIFPDESPPCGQCLDDHEYLSGGFDTGFDHLCWLCAQLGEEGSDSASDAAMNRHTRALTRNTRALTRRVCWPRPPCSSAAVHAHLAAPSAGSSVAGRRPLQCGGCVNGTTQAAQCARVSGHPGGCYSVADPRDQQPSNPNPLRSSSCLDGPGEQPSGWRGWSQQ